MTINKYEKSAKRYNRAEVNVFSPDRCCTHSFIIELGEVKGGEREQAKQEMIDTILDSLDDGWAICWVDWKDMRNDGSSPYPKAVGNVYSKFNTELPHGHGKRPLP
jgi:hypothetical protein